ncbi:lysozyme family protein [Aneurinibacillus aneurinilyticus]
MKRIKRWIGMLFILTGILFIGVFLIAIVNQDTSPLSNINKYEKVKRYDVLRAELRKYQLEEYTHVLLALMYQESRGEGGDPMQVSESAGLPPNTIDDPKRSIQ